MSSVLLISKRFRFGVTVKKGTSKEDNRIVEGAL